MSSSSINILNKINLPIKEVDEGPSIMWLMASCAENRDTLTFRDHSHTFFELHLVIKGSITYGLEGVVQTVGEGELFFIAPKKMHKVISCEGDFMKMTVAFEIAEGSELCHRLYQCSDTVLKMNESISENIGFITLLAEEKGDYTKDIIRSRLTEIVYFAAEAMSVMIEKSAFAKRFDPRVYRAKKYIDDNPQIFFSCEEISAFCRISPKQLGRLFKESEGISVLEYIHLKKMDYAKTMLKDKNLSEKRIADMLGFSGAEYFSRFFARLEGCLPSEYRKKL